MTAPQCSHSDTERVGAFEVVCFQCGKVADWRDILAGKEDPWKALGRTT